MYVEDVEDIKTSHNRCLLKYVEDVEDRSNTHKGCNAMYVEDVCRGITRIHRSPSRPRHSVRPTADLINIHEHLIKGLVKASRQTVN